MPPITLAAWLLCHGRLHAGRILNDLGQVFGINVVEVTVDVDVPRRPGRLAHESRIVLERCHIIVYTYAVSLI